MLVDSHVHLFHPSLCERRERFFHDPSFHLLYGKPGARMVDLPALTRYMDENGIGASLAMGFPWRGERDCDLQNDYFREAMDSSGNRIIPFGSVPLECGPGEAEARVAHIAATGLAGIGEVAFYSGGFSRESGKFLDLLLHAATNAGIPLCLHVNEPVGHSYPGKYDPDFDRLCGIIANNPRASVILSHWGGGLVFYEHMPEIAALLANCCYDTAATPYLYEESIYAAAVALAGAGRILVGSDYPLLPLSRYIDPVERAVPSPDERRFLLGENALRLVRRLPLKDE